MIEKEFCRWLQNVNIFHKVRVKLAIQILSTAIEFQQLLIIQSNKKKLRFIMKKKYIHNKSFQNSHYLAKLYRQPNPSTPRSLRIYRHVSAYYARNAL